MKALFWQENYEGFGGRWRWRPLNNLCRRHTAWAQGCANWDSRMRRESNASAIIRFNKQKSLWAVLTWMSVPHSQGRLHPERLMNRWREQFGRA